MRALMMLASPVLLVICCILIETARSGRRFIFLGVTTNAWAALAAMGALAGLIQLVFWWRSD